MNTLTTWILAGCALIAVVAVAIAGVQSSRLADSHAETDAVRVTLTATEAARDAAKAEAASVRADLLRTSAAMTEERDRALAAARYASDLRESLARDVGTERDAPTAPALVDVLRRLDRRAK